MQFNDALRRAARTFFQSFVGTLVMLAVPALTKIVTAVAQAKPYELDFAFWQSAIVAACAAGLISLITWVQNALEDKGTIPSVLKATASSGADPITRDPAK